MKVKLTVATLMAVVVMLGACASLEQLIQKPQIHFDSLGTRDMSLVDGTFLFRFNVANPNPVGVRLDDITYDLEINGERFVSSRLPQGVNLAASGTSPMEIPVTINYLDFFGSISRLIRSDDLAYRLSGSAGVGPLRIPYRTSGKLDVPRLPDISVERITVDSLSFSGASLKLALGMRNPNAFVLKMDGLEYAARMGGVEVGRGVARQLSPMAANGRSSMAIDLDLSFLELGRSAQALLSGAATRCQFSGNLLVDAMTGTQRVPFSFDGNVPLIR